MAKKPVTVVRVYEDPGRAAAGYRLLVDRLWSRGLTNAAVDHDEWAKEVASKAELRRLYGHVPDRFAEFTRRHRAELVASPPAEIVSRLEAVADRQPLGLLTATRDVGRSGVAVLQEALERRHH